jgi:probable HAF family extracellular repeat protein
MRTAIRLSALVAAVAGLALTGPATAVAQPRLSYRTVVLGTLGGAAGVPLGLNDRGAVVGWSNTAGGALHPFLWQRGRMTDLGTLDQVDGGWGMATDINRYGTIVGQSDLDGVRHAVRWEHGKITDLGTLGGTFATATAVNDHGVIAGSRTLSDGFLHAFVWRQGRMTDLGVPGGGDVVVTDLNNSDQIVGFAMPPDRAAFAYRWQQGRLTVLPASRYGGQARAINDRGTIVGSVFGADGGLAVRWSESGSRLLGTLPGGDASGAGDINDRGVILGGGNVASHSLDDHAFLWHRGVLRDLYQAGVPQSATALNNRGVIIGTVAGPSSARIAALFVPATV